MEVKNELTDLLSQEELKEVKGGIPYETPELYDISILNETCGTGRICSGGSGTSCDDGQVCSKGSTGPDSSSSTEGGL